MNLLELVAEVQQATHLGEEEIVAIVREAWPAHTQFTPTQAALVVNSIVRHRNSLNCRCGEPTPRTISEDQLWGKSDV